MTVAHLFLMQPPLPLGVLALARDTTEERNTARRSQQDCVRCRYASPHAGRSLPPNCNKTELGPWNYSAVRVGLGNTHFEEPSLGVPWPSRGAAAGLRVLIGFLDLQRPRIAITIIADRWLGLRDLATSKTRRIAR